MKEEDTFIRQREAKESPRAVNLTSRVGDSALKLYATSCVFFLERGSILGPLFINDQMHCQP